MLTKNYFKKFQIAVVGFCIFCAALVGSVQTAFIIFSINKKGKKKNTNTKAQK